MNKLVTDQGGVPMLEIECIEDVHALTHSLTNNGYEIQVTPVYETEEDLKNRGSRIYGRGRARIKYYSVKILGFISKPEYDD